MDIQARIPPALAAVHNFISKYDSTDLEQILQEMDNGNNGGEARDYHFGTLSEGVTTPAETEQAKTKRDSIAHAMWESYLQECDEWGT